MNRISNLLAHVGLVGALLLSLDSVALELFDPSVEPLAPASEMPSWNDLLQRTNAQSATIEACFADDKFCKGRLRSVKLLVEKGTKLSRSRQVSLVNRYINRFTRYREDKRKTTKFGEVEITVNQQWASLVEFLKVGGDCEDYATAKYQLFRLLGIPAEELRVIVVYDRSEREHHAILAVANVGKSDMLLDTDNRTYRRRPASYRYVYGVNETYVWDYGAEKTRHSRTVRRELRKD